MRIWSCDRSSLADVNAGRSWGVRRAGGCAGAFLLADISGYTSFLQGITDAHAELIAEPDEPAPVYSLLSSLLDSMATAIAPSFEVMKFEGDAIGQSLAGRSAFRCRHQPGLNR